MKIYAMDVDETLEISGGPVPIKMLVELKEQGHIVGICGNWAKFVQCVPNWFSIVSFVSCLPSFHDEHMIWRQKDWFLRELKTYIPAEEHIMVGNILGISGDSDDKGAAERAGWRFVKESDFANGVR